MAGEHPSEPTLLAYVEDELGADERSEVDRHVAGCATCAADVAAARTGRDVLRAAHVLAVPAGARGRLLADRPQRVAAARGERRWLALAAPVAAALALAGGIATVAVWSPGGGESDDAGEGAVAEESAADDAGGDTGAAEGGAEPEPQESVAKDTVLRVAAEPEELAAELRLEGFDARVEGSAVVVTTDRRTALRRALRDYPRGSVAVRVE